MGPVELLKPATRDILVQLATKYQNPQGRTNYLKAFEEHPEWQAQLGLESTQNRHTSNVRGAFALLRKEGVIPTPAQSPKAHKTKAKRRGKAIAITTGHSNAPLIGNQTAGAAPGPNSRPTIRFCPCCGSDIESLLLAANAMAERKKV